MEYERQPGVGKQELSHDLESDLFAFINEVYAGEQGHELREEYVRAVKESDWEALVDLEYWIQAKLDYLRGKFPEEWEKLNRLHGHLAEFLEKAG